MMGAISVQWTTMACVVVVALLGYSRVALAQGCDPNDPDCNALDVGVGTAISEVAPSGRRLMSFNKNEVEAVADVELTPEVLSRRRLLQSQCSTGPPTAALLTQCTNAVRMDPGAFKQHYTCDSSSWINSYPGRGSFRSHDRLNQMAQLHSEDQARNRRMSHTGSNGSTMASRARNAGYSYRGIAENVAYGQRSALQVVMGWMCSGGHRRNMMSCGYSELGVGVAFNGGTPYYTQNFGCPSGGSCGCGGGGGGGASNPPSFNPPPVRNPPAPTPTRNPPSFSPPSTPQGPFPFSPTTPNVVPAPTNPPVVPAPINRPPSTPFQFDFGDFYSNFFSQESGSPTQQTVPQAPAKSGHQDFFGRMSQPEEPQRHHYQSRCSRRDRRFGRC